MPEPRQTPGLSEQDVATPMELIRAVESRFGPIAWDLAASAWNSWGRDGFYDKEQDSLQQDWTLHNGVLWLNPEFGRLKPWACKSLESAGPGRTILLLTPLTTCNWATEYVWGKGYVIGLNGRVKFVGHKIGFPKDLMLTVYGWGVGFEVWDWRNWVRQVPLAPGAGSTPAAPTIERR